MKIQFVADLHLKLGAKNVPVAWAINRYNLLFAELAKLQERTDLTIIGGDIFDRVPNMAELELYYTLVDSMRQKTLIYAGNHEALHKGTTFLTHLKGITSKINPLVTIVDEAITYADVDANKLFNILPYNKLKAFEKNPSEFFQQDKAPILFTHVRAAIPPHVRPELDLTLLKPWKMVIAGDLHSHENTQLNIVYPGSPITTSFHRNSVDTGVLIVDTNTVSYEFVKLDMPQLLRKTVNVGEPTPATFPDHTIYEVTGNIAELSDLEDNELISAKVTKRESTVQLELKEMTMEEELTAYLKEMLHLNEDQIEAILGEFNDYI